MLGLQDPLGRHVLLGAHLGRLLVQSAHNLRRDPEVGQLEVTVHVEHQVYRLDVSVQDFQLTVQHLESLHNLEHEQAQVAFGDFLLTTENVLESAAVHVLDQRIEPVASPAEVVELDDLTRVDLAHIVELADRGQFDLDFLDGEDFQVPVGHLLHDSLAALPDFFHVFF